MNTILIFSCGALLQPRILPSTAKRVAQGGGTLYGNLCPGFQRHIHFVRGSRLAFPSSHTIPLRAKNLAFGLNSLESTIDSRKPMQALSGLLIGCKNPCVIKPAA
ncbi:hypothetical protein LX36DRAFT_311521 [Colletotrichum falcatum]|nr:hypothetical protein LX36DRAFT_311521 [Colletotrichum falcatum]